MEFEWDENKNRTNLEKHGVDFEQAKKVFFDDFKSEMADNRKDYGEQRLKTVGKSLDLILSVIYTIRETVIRIISARSASSKERNIYNQKLH